MKFNCIVPDFLFLGSAILELNVDNKLSMVPEDLIRKFGMDIIFSELTAEEKTWTGKLLLKILIELEQNDKKVCSIDMTLEGAFSSPLSVDEQKFKELVLINGAAALFSVARAKIENISATMFASGKIVLPFVNIYDFYEEKNKKNKAPIIKN